MGQQATSFIRQLLFCLSFVASEANFARGQVLQGRDQPEFECPVSASPWECYGSMEISVSMELDSPDKVVPTFRQQVTRFVNQEVLIESESFGAGPHGERRLSSYFVLGPSAVTLASGWETWQNPRKEAGHVIEELRNVAQMLQAAFPKGPNVLNKDWQTVDVNVKEYVYPLGERMTHKTIRAKKNPDGRVYFSFRGFGEPIGPYLVSGNCSSTKPAPLSDDSPVPGAVTKQRFETLGRARAYAPAPAP